MKEEKSEAIVLKAYPYKDTGRILHLFTPELGIIHLIIRRLSQKKPRLVNLATPLCHGHFVYRKGKTDLHTFTDGSIQSLHLPLRQSLSALEHAGKMLNAIHLSQFPGKASPKLFRLLIAYLKNLPLSPETLWASFQLKLLHHEGLISLSEGQLNSSLGPITLPEEDFQQLILLLGARDFSSLSSITLTPTFQKTIEELFKSFLKT